MMSRKTQEGALFGYKKGEGPHFNNTMFKIACSQDRGGEEDDDL